MDQNVLSILIFLPVVAALGLMLMPNGSEKGIKGFAMVAALINAALALSLLGTFDPAKPGYQFEVNAPWLPNAGISYHLGIDGISLVLVVLTAVLTPVALLASWNLIKDRVRGYNAWMLMLSAGMIGAVVSLDMFLFYVFFELMLIPAFFLIGLWGGEGRVKATIKFVVYTLVGSLFLFVAILYLAVQHQAATGTWSFQLADLMATPLAGPAMVWAFLAFAFAFAIKSGLFPFHTWAPDTYVAAPAPVTFLVSGIMGKIGVYAFIRFAMPLFPEAAKMAQPYLMGLAVIGLIYAAWVALAQTDIKRMLAYSSVSHMAVILLGVFALDQHAWTGAVFMFMAHALATGGLFLMVGMLAERKGTQIADFGGIAKAMPWMTTLFILVAMASVGLPGLNGFIGEFMILLGSYTSHNVLGAVATTSVIWGACYMLWTVSRTFFGEEKPASKPLADLSIREALVILPIALVIVYTGFVPQPVLSRIDTSVQAVLGPVNAAVKAAAAEPAAATEGDHHAGGH
ncbi:NADH-quinone oxidoreductase subunit M [compost metagenome]